MLVLASGLGLAMTAISAQAQTTQRSYDRNGYCNYSATTYSDGSTRTTTNTHDQNGNLTYSHTTRLCPLSRPLRRQRLMSGVNPHT